MFQPIFKILLNRNLILVMAVVAGLLFGQHSVLLEDYILLILGFVMMFSMTGIENQSLLPVRSIFRPVLEGIVLNYIFFGAVLIPLAWLLMPDRELFYGMVIIASTPPGVAVIPFSYVLKGNMRYSILGTFGAFIGSIFMAPLMVYVFTGGREVDPIGLFWLMVKLVVVPFLLSRLLLHRNVFSIVGRVRGHVVNWGFALIIFTAVGMNRQVFYGDISILLLISGVLLISLFGVGSLYGFWAGSRKDPEDITLSRTLLLTIKSSGFAAVTALSLFGERAAIPSAVLAVMVLLYLIYLSLRKELRDRKTA